MSQNFVVENIEFKMKTQAMLHFAPMVFTMKQPRRRDLILSETHYWSPEAHGLLGSHFITILDQDGLLRKIKVNQFLQELNPSSHSQLLFLITIGILREAFL